jgi:hypothetical protein
MECAPGAERANQRFQHCERARHAVSNHFNGFFHWILAPSSNDAPGDFGVRGF